MTVYDDPELLLASQGSIRDILVGALRGGYLSLFVGAGISMSTTTPPGTLFPSWPDLVKACCLQVGLAFDDAKRDDNTYLRKQAEEVEAESVLKSVNFLKVVESALYGSRKDYDKASLKVDLLVALGSMVMSSVRGSASAVINYNFDDLLEWYLALHGFKVEVVSKVPELVPKADVVVYHPHGFLPLNSRFKPHRTDSVIFSERSYQRAERSDAWNEIQRSRFGSNICLFVGMSGDDPHVEQLFAAVHDQLKGSRILGVLVTADSPKSRANESHIKRRGVLNYYLASHDELPDFLLGLCQSAAQL